MRFLRDVSIRNKLRWIIMITSSVALLISCCAFIIYELVSFQNSMTRELSMMADVIAANSNAALEFNDPLVGEETLGALEADPRIVVAAIYDRSGEIFAEYHSAGYAGGQVPPEPRTGKPFIEGGRLNLCRPIIFDGETTGTIYIQSDFREVYARLRQYAAIVIGVLLASFLVALLMSSSLQRVISRPILHLAETASLVSAKKDYSLRATKQGRDEIGLLVDRFNDMLAQILERDMALRDSEERYRTLIESQQEGVAVIDLRGRFALANPAAHSIFGVPQGDLLNRDINEFVARADVDVILIKRRSEGRDKKRSHEFEITRRDGNRRVLIATITPRFDSAETLAGTFAVFRDITDRKEAEQRIRASLKEKEVLLKEIHHRVKNNLQVISSLLYLQSKSIRDKRALDLFRESQNRVKSMALIHEKLYGSEDLVRIDFAEYIRNLTAHLFSSYGLSSQNIRLEADVTDVSLDIEKAIPYGLIINELVSNCLKYAFPDGGSGEIKITLESGTDGDLTLIVGDDGVGMPHAIDFRNTDSLGLQLVNTLVQQLGANIELDRTDGTRFTITSRMSLVS